MNQLLFASRNLDKLREVQEIISSIKIEVVTPSECQIPESFKVEETGLTFSENTQLKAVGYGKLAMIPTLADDSGLEVLSLANQPGVFSKRYGATDEIRISRILKELDNSQSPDRSARFVCVMCLYDPVTQDLKFFQGEVSGQISHEPRGEFGFGYDPIFIPDQGDGRTFAEYGPEFKNQISHRARAIEKLKYFLKQSAKL